MATITSAAAGNWTATSTWTGAVVPGLADTAKIMHKVTVDADVSVGGIDPTSTGCLVDTAEPIGKSIAVGPMQVCFIAKGLNIFGGGQTFP